MKISSVAEMRDMDRRAVEEFGIPAAILMENAGGAAARVLGRVVSGSVRGKRVVFICGPGNNGGDALVAARQILAAGGTPLVRTAADPAGYREAAATNYESVVRLGVDVRRIEDSAGVERLRKDLQACDAVVDGLLGTGLARPVEGLFRKIIDAVNLCGKPVVSLDIPSGVQGDTGAVLGGAVQAAATVAFGSSPIGGISGGKRSRSQATTL